MNVPLHFLLTLNNTAGQSYTVEGLLSAVTGAKEVFSYSNDNWVRRSLADNGQTIGDNFNLPNSGCQSTLKVGLINRICLIRLPVFYSLRFSAPLPSSIEPPALAGAAPDKGSIQDRADEVFGHPLKRQRFLPHLWCKALG